MIAKRVGLAAISLLACAGGHVGRSSSILQPGQLASNWYAGGATCAGGSPARFRVHAYTDDFFILRQPACTNYEKPFLYLLIGSDRALLLDTGAGGVDVATPVDTLIRSWLARHGAGRPSIDLIVAHSHAHGDHVAGDGQFANRPHVTLVGRDTTAVRAFFGIPRCPDDTAVFQLDSVVHAMRGRMTRTVLRDLTVWPQTP